ncbi:MAG: hypothetical protein ACYCO4_00140 [Sulfobacillus sp.]
MWWRNGWVVASTIAVAAALAVTLSAADSSGQPPSQLMLQGKVQSVSQGWFDLLVQEGPYCPSWAVCPLSLAQPRLYVVTDQHASIFSQAGMRLPAADLRPGVQAVVSGQDLGHDRMAATGVLLLGNTIGFCGWPDPYGPPCPIPAPVTRP